jgi:hypothetical protein
MTLMRRNTATNYIEHSPSWEANVCSTNQKNVAFYSEPVKSSQFFETLILKD